MAFLSGITCDTCGLEKTVLIPSGHTVPSMCDDCRFPEPDARLEVERLITELREEFQEAKQQLIKYERRLAHIERLKHDLKG